MAPGPAEFWAELQITARASREAPNPVEAFRAIGESMDRLIGSRMFTFLRFDEARFDMERLYCTLPERYPVGARKPMRHGRWSECLLAQGRVFIASGPEEMRATFGDFTQLAEIGCTSTMCVPVRHAGRTLGSMNLNGDAGRYGEREAAAAEPFAALAVPAFLTLEGRASVPSRSG